MTVKDSTISYGLESKEKNIVKFNDALDLTGFGKFNVWITLLCGLMATAIVLETMGFSYILPAAQCDLGLTLTQKGWVGAIPFVGLILSSQFWGFMADTRGRRKVLMVSMTLGCTCSMISSFSPNLITFAILRLFAAALMSAANNVLYPYYGEFAPKAYLDTMVSVLASITMFSTGVSTLIAWGILSLDFDLPIAFLGISYKPWRLMVVCFAFPFILATVALFKAPESPKYLMSQGENEKALKIVKSIYRINTGKDESTFKVDELILDDMDKLGLKNVAIWTSLKSQTVPLFKPPYIKYMVIFFFLNFGVFACANAFFVWMPDTINRFYIGLEEIDSENKIFCELMGIRSERANGIIRNSTDTQVCNDSLNAETYPMMLIITCVLGFLNIFLAFSLHYFRKKAVLMSCLAVCCISALIMNWVRAPWVSWGLLVIIQSCIILIGILTTYAVEIFPTNYRAMAVSLTLMFGRLGAVAGTNVLGYIMEVMCPANFYGSAFLFLVCFSCTFLLPTEKNKPETTRL